jgi:hypothetical protein
MAFLSSPPSISDSLLPLLVGAFQVHALQNRIMDGFSVEFLRLWKGSHIDVTDGCRGGDPEWICQPTR